MAASNDGKLETSKAKNRPLEGARTMPGADLVGAHRAQSVHASLPSGPPDKNFWRFRAKKSPRFAANLTTGSLFSSDQIEGSWKRLTSLL